MAWIMIDLNSNVCFLFFDINRIMWSHIILTKNEYMLNRAPPSWCYLDIIITHHIIIRIDMSITDTEKYIGVVSLEFQKETG